MSSGKPHTCYFYLNSTSSNCEGYNRLIHYWFWRQSQWYLGCLFKGRVDFWDHRVELTKWNALNFISLQYQTIVRQRTMTLSSPNWYPHTLTGTTSSSLNPWCLNLQPRTVSYMLVETNHPLCHSQSATGLNQLLKQVEVVFSIVLDGGLQSTGSGRLKFPPEQKNWPEGLFRPA